MQNNESIFVPADVPLAAQGTYQDNYTTLTHGTDRLFLFAYDQWLEHGISDFSGAQITHEAINPEHAFNIAEHGVIGAFAVHPGLIARYAKQHTSVTYVAKITGKTNLVSPDVRDPISSPLLDVQQIVDLKQESELDICGIGLTLYPGSSYENEMITFASHTIYQAHQHGFVTIIWIYPRGHSITDDTSLTTLGAAVGIATSLGADFVKIKPPHDDNKEKSADILASLVDAAGNTKLICSGGPLRDVDVLLSNIHNELHNGKTSGVALGRNLFQRPFDHAVALTEAVDALIYDDASYNDALNLYNTHKDKK